MRLALVRKRQCWWPTRRAWVLFSLLIAVFGTLMFRSAGNFLALNQPVQADVLIVEGWIPDYAIRDAIAEFRRGHYRFVITSGVALPIGLTWAGNYSTWAEVAAVDLQRFGLEAEVITPIGTQQPRVDRTYSSALAVRDWLERQDGSRIRSVNIYTISAHARRSKLLFQKALGHQFRVGVVAHPDVGYDSAHWWATSEGFREVSSEALAYLYARFIFPFLSQGRVE